MTAPSNGPIFQNSVYIGINIQNILYGIELLLYSKTIYILLTDRGARDKPNVFYALFSSVMMFAITVWVATQAVFGETMWLLQPDYPGGPDAYWEQNDSIWYMDWGSTSVILLQLMTDALMIYRCRIIWNNYRVIVMPIILWLGTLVMALLVDWTTSSPGGNFFAGVSSQLGLAYYTMSVFLNVTLTCMLCYPMVQHAKKVKEYLGTEYASLYFAAVTIIVESVFPYTLSGIAFLVSLGAGSPTSVAFMCVYVLMMCISPQMLILRVIARRAWDKDTFGSTIKFSHEHETTPGSQPSDNTREGVYPQTSSQANLSDGHGKV